MPGSWKQGVSALDLLWGPALEISQTTVVMKEDEKPTSGSSVTAVVFLGGCTYGEVAALRYLEKIVNRRFVILTTEFITHRTLLFS